MSYRFSKCISLISAVTVMATLAAQTSLPSSTAYADSKNSTDTSSNLFPAILNLSTSKAVVGTNIAFTVSGIKPNENAQMIWDTQTGSYKLDGTYSFISPVYNNKAQTLLIGKSNAKGVWSGHFVIPAGFGGDHTVFVLQAGKEVTQSDVYVAPTFQMFPKSGPLGTPITIKVDGLGASAMDSNWQLTYDNRMTGLISAVSTNGSAVVKIRAAGPVGNHTITIWHGYLGMPYVNYTEAPTAYLPVPTFSFQVTKNVPVNSYVEPIPPTPVGGGVKMPALHNAPGVSVILSRSSGTVGQPDQLQVTGLPSDNEVDIVWNSMSGSRVSGNGFDAIHRTLGSATTDANGNLQFNFSIPDDLGGIPHRIDLTIGGKVVGQAYLRILPSIVEVTPESGPVGTKISVELKGVGWTEFDNTYYITYDNGYVGYACGFNSQGTVKLTLTASGDPGYHLIDLYPGIYRGKKPEPNIYNAPQLTYYDDHPGDALPAIRAGFNITKQHS